MINEWLINRWEESRVAIGYYLWVGVPLLSIFFWMLGYSKDWIIFGVSHFTGLFIVAKYHWFTFDKLGEQK